MFLIVLCVSCLVSLSKVVVHLPRRLAPTHLLLSLVLTPNQARGRLERRQAVRPAYLNVYVGCIERTRRDT